MVSTFQLTKTARFTWRTGVHGTHGKVAGLFGPQFRVFSVFRGSKMDSILDSWRHFQARQRQPGHVYRHGTVFDILVAILNIVHPLNSLD